MRLKVEVAGGLLGNVGKNRPSNKPALIQFRFARVRIVQHDKSDKLRVIGR